MAVAGSYVFGNRLDIEQLMSEAQQRWLRPAEICKILSNYKIFRIAPEPPNLPPSGSLFLFDRKVLRYFRKDGHNWRKKKDGKTVKEAHERLKSGSVDVLHCYYAHGEENENFQRRSYWLLDEDYSHIVLVHYLEVKGNRAHFSRIKQTADVTQKSQETKENLLNSGIENSQTSSSDSNAHQMISQNTDTTSLTSGQGSEYEDADSAYSHQARTRYCSFAELQLYEQIYPPIPVPYSRSDVQIKFSDNPTVGFPSVELGHIDKAETIWTPEEQLQEHIWEDLMLKCNVRAQFSSVHPTFSAIKPESLDAHPVDQHVDKPFTDGIHRKRALLSRPHGQGSIACQSTVCVGPELRANSAGSLSSFEHDAASMNQSSSVSHLDKQRDVQAQLSNSDITVDVISDIDGNSIIEQNANNFSVAKHFLGKSSQDETLKKNDSFNRWMSKELSFIEANLETNPASYWSVVGDGSRVNDTAFSPEDQLDTFVLGPSLSQDQLFSIIDYSPNWAYSGSETKVLVTGKFLKSQTDVEKCNWSCMFGEVEVPADILANGVLRCIAPPCFPGRVPFYITSSNRVACSEVREFEYRDDNVILSPGAGVTCTDNTSEVRKMRFSNFLSVSTESSLPCDSHDMLQLKGRLSSLMEEEDEWLEMLQLTNGEECPLEEVKERMSQKILKEKLYTWLLHKASEGGKGPSVLDENGQGVLHFAASLGYDWAILPTIAAGVNVNFRDVHGWTALHWAAFCGRERTVAYLISQGAAAGALTDPNATYRLGRTAADLASANGHKGIAGYLAESALGSHLDSLNLKDQIRDVAENLTSEPAATPRRDREHTCDSLKHSLAAVCNATQAAARIHQVFRVQSFQRKQMMEYSDDQLGMSNERALSIIYVKTQRGGRYDGPVQAAAIRIQNKFRGWKGRKDFLTIRQQIVKIQALVRGHQVRKSHKKFVWSVSIVEKVILRWRRKGAGLRGFKPDALTASPHVQATASKVDEYDYLKDGKKQTEERLQKALTRVKSMVQYPEARDQYQRMLSAVSEIKETKEALKDSDTVDMDSDLLDL